MAAPARAPASRTDGFIIADLLPMGAQLEPCGERPAFRRPRLLYTTEEPSHHRRGTPSVKCRQFPPWLYTLNRDPRLEAGFHRDRIVDSLQSQGVAQNGGARRGRRTASGQIGPPDGRLPVRA